MSEQDYISSKAAQALLQRTERQVRRYAETGQIRSRRRGNRVEYSAADVQRLIDERPIDDRPYQAQAPDIVPAGEMMRLVQQLNEEIRQSAAREAMLLATLARMPQLDDHQALQASRDEERRQRELLERDLVHEQERRQIAEQQLQQTEQRAINAEQGRQRISFIAVALLVLLLVALGSVIYFAIGHL